MCISQANGVFGRMRQEWIRQRVNISGDGLRPLPACENASALSLRLRSMVTPAQMFWKLFSDDMVNHIVTYTQASVPPTTRGYTTQITVNHIKGLIALLVECCGTRSQDLGRLLDTQQHFTHSIYERVRKYLHFDAQVLFDMLNSALRDGVQVGGPSAIDETILPFVGDSIHVVYIPRKPKDTGIRLYLHCYALRQSLLPVCYYVLPDIASSCYTPREVMDVVIVNVPPGAQLSVTLDSLFATLGWLRCKSDISTYFSMGPAQLNGSYSAMVHNLNYGDYRLFADGKCVLSVWRDNAIHICGTNAASVSQSKSPDKSKYVVRSELLSPEDVKVLGELTGEGLKTLSREMGLSQGN